MNKANKSILIAVLVILVLGVAYAYTVNDFGTQLGSTKSNESLDSRDSITDIVPRMDPSEPPSTVPEPVVCTADAKQCPDGSYVGRTGPNCEFAECPPVVETPAKIVDRQATARGLTTKDACEREGGTWKPMMSGETYFCVLPTSDAGEACTDGSQCESWCEAPNGSASGDSVQGTCAAFTHASCSQEVVRGIARAEACE